MSSVYLRHLMRGAGADHPHRGRDVDARMLRVSFHPEADRVVLSIWDHDVCVATLRLAPENVPELVHGLTASLVAPQPIGRGSTVAIPIPCPATAASA